MVDYLDIIASCDRELDLHSKLNEFIKDYL